MVPLADSEDRNKMVRDRGMREKQDRHTQTHTHTSYCTALFMLLI